LKEQTRYRVTGSLFLLALAVIGLPMLFDGAGLPARELPPVTVDEPLPEVTRLPDEPPQTDFIARVDELRREVDEDGFHRGTATRFGEPVLAPLSGDTSVWAVQVASFAEPDNAQDFRTRLREDGYEAFISTVRADGALRSRVAVGPLLNRQQAQSLQSELSARYQVEAQLMAFAN
jgi:DedD protein